MHLNPAQNAAVRHIDGPLLVLAGAGSGKTRVVTEKLAYLVERGFAPEQLLAITRDELPYSIATQVTEWEWPRIRVDIVVERESQKGMVIGKGGANLKAVGQKAREQLPQGAFLELRVRVDKDWQRRPDRVQRLGY